MSKRVGICGICKRKRWLRLPEMCQVCYWQELSAGRVTHTPNRYDVSTQRRDFHGIDLMTERVDRCEEQVERNRRVALYAELVAARQPLFPLVCQ